jgi:hypothetical protein
MIKILLALLLCSCLLTNAQLPTYVPANGLIAWWGFNGSTNDDSGNNNNGTNNGAVLTTDRFGNTNSAYSFDGSSSYLSIPTSASLESPTTRLTMSAWINLSGYSLVGQAFGPILTKSNSSANAFMYRFTVDINGISFYAGINNWSSNTGAAYNFSLNQWYLLTAVLDSFTSYLYLNDSLIATNVFTTSITSDGLPLEIGRDDPGSTEVFNGKIDDIGIWNVALTPQEVSNLYLGPTVGTSELVMEEGLHIYPNPSLNEVIVQLPNVAKEITELILYDAQGNVVKNLSPLTIINKSEFKISVAGLSEGIYFLKAVGDSKKILTEKIIVIK